jgi:glycerol 3-phosphatase-1
MISPASKIFSSPPQEATFEGLLFDRDGTIIDSTEAVVKHWHRFALPFHLILLSNHTSATVHVQG